MSKDMYLTTREVQLEELEMLKKVISFCDKHNIKYFLYGGTALGAVRHGGFIPWDDDIDIIMPRPDYENFTSLIKNGYIIDQNFDVQIPELIKNPKSLIAKVYNKKIMVDAKNGSDTGFLWIDIMQLDGLPSNPKKYLQRLLVLRRIYFAKMRQKYHVYDGTRSMTRNVLRFIKSMPLVFIKYDWFIRRMISYCKKYDYNTSNLVCNTAWYNTPTKVFEKEWFREATKIKFEDIEANICIDYDKYLSKRFGKNYMMMPPKEKQITHSFDAWYAKDEKNVKG